MSALDPSFYRFPGGYFDFRERTDCPPLYVEVDSESQRIRDQENRIRVAIDDLVEFLNVMGAD